MSVAAPLVLREGDRSGLEALTRSGPVRAGRALRARIVSLAAQGPPNAEIARRTGTSRPTVLDRRARYDPPAGSGPFTISRAAGGRRRSTRSMSWSRRWPMTLDRRRTPG